MAAKITHYKVVFDTNGVRGNHFVTPGLHDSLRDAKKNKLIHLEYLLPEIVRDEWSNNYLNQARPQLEKIAHATEAFSEMQITGHTFSTPSEEEIRDMGNQYLAKMGFTIIPTPYEKIDFADLCYRATRHLAPFEADSDKGLKDALIGQTVKSLLEQGLKPDEGVIVICRDGLLVDYINELFPNNYQVQIFPSMMQFKSHVDLQANNLSEALAPQASDLFHKDTDASTIYYKEDLRKRVTDFYYRNFPEAPTAIKYIENIPHRGYLAASTFRGLPRNSYEFGKSTLKVGETTFISRKNTILSWSTRLSLMQEYNPISAEIDGVLIPAQPNPIAHVVVFDVTWYTTLSSRLTLRNPVIDSIKPIKEHAESRSALDRLLGNGFVSAYQTSLNELADISKTAYGQYMNSLPSIQPVEDVSGKSLIQTVMDINTSISSTMGDTKKHFWENSGNNAI